MQFNKLIASVILTVTVAALPAIAGPRTFVSGLGNDANPGTREQPKRTFASALTVTNPGGQIVALDSAGYGSSTLTIDKSISIIVPPGVAGFITVSTGNGITINADATDVVSIRGLIIETSSAESGAGIRSNGVATLTLEDCAIRNFAQGISFVQSKAGHLQVHGGSLRQNLSGIFVQPSASVPLDAIVTGCLLENNFHGFHVAPGFGTVRLTAADCTMAGNNTGVLSTGSGAIAYLDNCRLSNNAQGINPQNSGKIISLGNNSFTNNGSPGAFTSTTPRF